MLSFFSSYFLLLLASSITITAFFCITRGDIEILPDGSKRKYGKIFKGYYFFWFREKGTLNIQFKDDSLAGLIYSIKEYYQGEIHTPGNMFRKGSVVNFETSPAILEVMPLLRNKLEVDFKIDEESTNYVIISAFRDDPVYVFPEWLRTVMAGCITCAATVYGNLIYWCFILFFKKSVLYASMFYCFDNTTVGIVLVWLAYWISLAWLNTVLWNIYDK